MLDNMIKYGKVFIDELNRNELYNIVDYIVEQGILIDEMSYAEFGKTIIEKLQQENLISPKKEAC